MLTYYDLSIPMRSLLILGFFLTFCVGGCALWVVLRRTRLLPKLLVALGFITSGICVILYTAEATWRLRAFRLPAVADRFCRLPLAVLVVLLLIILAWFLHICLKEQSYRKRTITRSSIKEGIDKISSGLCFYREDGRVILTNQQMQKLSFAIAGKDLQNAALFWQFLQSETVKTDAERLSTGERPSFRLADGTVWTFACENLGGICQLSAADTTQVQAVTDQLQAKNADLAALNLRLRKYGENVDELTRSKERLETKARIHSELGQALLATRRYLLDETGTQAAPLELWQRNIAMLRREAVLKEKEQPLEMLKRIAVSTGIAIEISGEFPKNEAVQTLVVQAAAEALTNAISHAHAKHLYISLEESESFYAAHFKNDGSRPDREIIEGGGLTSLRNKIEHAGGVMEVNSLPDFILTVTLPKERGERR